MSEASEMRAEEGSGRHGWLAGSSRDVPGPVLEHPQECEEHKGVRGRAPPGRRQAGSPSHSWAVGHCAQQQKWEGMGMTQDGTAGPGDWKKGPPEVRSLWTPWLKRGAKGMPTWLLAQPRDPGGQDGARCGQAGPWLKAPRAHAPPDVSDVPAHPLHAAWHIALQLPVEPSGRRPLDTHGARPSSCPPSAAVFRGSPASSPTWPPPTSPTHVATGTRNW